MDHLFGAVASDASATKEMAYRWIRQGWIISFVPHQSDDM